MKSIAITDVDKVEIMEFETPKPEKGEVLIKILRCALCTSEQRAFHGITNWPKPYVGGHEVSGVIVELGKECNGDWKVGDRVALRTFANCGTCYYCQQGYNNQCANMDKILFRHPENAGLSQYMVLSESQLFKLNDDVTLEEGCLCEPISCVIHSITKANIDLGDDVVVIGMGIMGLLHVQLAKMKGARVIAIEIDEKRRELAKKYGADIVFTPKEKDQVEYVKELTCGRGADVVINTTSVYTVAGDSIKMLGKLGRGIQYASQHPNEPVPIKLGMIHNTETSLIGTVSPSTNDFRRAIKLLNMHAIKLDDLIAAVVPFEDAQKAFEMATPGTYRIIINMED